MAEGAVAALKNNRVCGDRFQPLQSSASMKQIPPSRNMKSPAAEVVVERHPGWGFIGAGASPLRLGLAGWGLFAWAAVAAQAQHLHIQAQFDSVSGWSIFWQDFDSGPFPADAYTLPLGAEARRRILADPALTNHLVAADHAVWTLPQFNEPSLPSLGFGSQGTAGSLSSGSVRLRLATFTGPGHFALHASGVFGDTQIFMATRDGLDASDALTLAFPGGHEHANWSFTRPGLYELGFMAEGTQAANGQPTSSLVTVFRFHVAEIVPPRLRLSQEAGRQVITVDGEGNNPLRLETAVGLPHWTTVTNLWLSGTSWSWTNTFNDPHRFFRVHVPLP